MTFWRAVKGTAIVVAALYVNLVLYVTLWAASCWNCADSVGNTRHVWILAVALVYGPLSMLILAVLAVLGISAWFLLKSVARLL